MPFDSAALEIPLAINLAAVFVGALVGTLRAGEEEHVDLVGMFTLAAAMGFGGGLVRDVLLGNLPPAAFRDPSYLITAAVATLVAGVALVYLRRVERALWVLDSLAIGLFACVGANAALIAGLQLLPAILIGTCASVGGLILADVLQGRPSSIMYVGPPNAVAGFAGALVYSVFYSLELPVVALVLAIVATVAMRVTGRFFHWTIPQPRRRAYELRIRRAQRPSDRAHRTTPTSRRRARRLTRMQSSQSQDESA
ncbi:trimeric intracellular cation channel family protein [Demequina oxidasica]|uniref:trimeric intracellular cation channel family protein n=1 Tax=Demequina oxidasica TaxID=676199 RepID=UPI000783C938|nr:TRIC cation channel family protein [Demequina oxidasica]